MAGRSVEIDNEVSRLHALAQFCRDAGVTRLTVGDVIMVMGPDPIPDFSSDDTTASFEGRA